MLKRLTWQQDLVLSLQLADDLYTLAQMRVGSRMQFYDVRSADGHWQGIDLSNVPSLFCVTVAENRLKPLFVEKVDARRVQPDRRPMPVRMIDYEFAADGPPRANLIELDAQQDYSNIGARVVKAGLTIKRDLDLIRSHELVGMHGSPEKLRQRLQRYFETGVNWDDAKAFVFPGIAPPPSPSRPAKATTRPVAKRARRRRADTLQALSAATLLKEGDPALRRAIRPLLATLIAELGTLPADVSDERKLQTFERALKGINRHAQRIETVEREAILGALYRIGAAVGLAPDSQFAERWRGDW